MGHRSAVAVALVLVAGALVPAGAATAGQTTERVSVTSAGAQADRHGIRVIGCCSIPWATRGGRFVVFTSGLRFLVPQDVNRHEDVFVHDRATGATELVSATLAGFAGNGESEAGTQSASADGRFVVFTSSASNLVPGDTNGHEDVFLRDRLTGTTRLLDVTPGGRPAAGGASSVAISPDGAVAAFTSASGDLVPGDTNRGTDVFARELATGRTERVSVATNGRQAEHQIFFGSGNVVALSTDGSVVAFMHNASNLVPGDADFGSFDIFVHDRRSGTTELVSDLNDGLNDDATSLAISASGRFVAFAAPTALVPGDTNGDLDVYVRDRRSGAATRVSVGPDGRELDGQSVVAGMSADARIVGFISDARSLLSRPSFGLFVRDRRAHTTQRADVTAAGEPPGDEPVEGLLKGSLSADGRFAAFLDDATTLVAGDTNRFPDTFVRVLGTAGLGDVTAPRVVLPPVPELVAPATVALDGTVPVRVRWYTPDRSGICRYALEQQVGTGPFTPVALPGPRADRLALALRAGDPRLRLRVRATDCSGNATPLAAGPPFALSLLGDAAPAIAYAGPWQVEADATALGGSLHVGGSQALLRFRGHAVAWVARRDPQAGSVHVAVDGRTAGLVSLRSALTRPRQVVFARAFPGGGEHTIKLFGASAPFTVDAFVVIR